MDLNVHKAEKRDWEFIRQNHNEDVSKLALTAKFQSAIPLADLLHQIACRQKASTKLPEFVEKNIWFPKKLSLEQSSSQATALFKASLLSGESFVDLSGGFGVDFYYLSQNFNSATYVEKEPYLVALAEHNFRHLKKSKQFLRGEAIDFIEKYEGKFDWAYVDPARRDEKSRKVFQWDDCSPNMKEIQPELLQKSDKVMIKASPMLDINKAVRDLQRKVYKVVVVEYQKEVKEVLYLCQKNATDLPEIEAIELNDKGKPIQQISTINDNEKIDFSDPLQYIYEPSASIMKAALFTEMANAFQLKKLSQNSHLFTSDDYVSNFFGRSFKCLGICSANRKELMKILPDLRASVKIRNFPAKTADLKKKLKLSDSNQYHIFASSLQSGAKKLVVCEKI